MNFEGYTESKSWEAWSESAKVMWDNTELAFVVSITISLAAVIMTWIQYRTPKVQPEVCMKEILRDSPDGSEVTLSETESSIEKDIEEENLMEDDEVKPCCKLETTKKVQCQDDHKILTEEIKLKMTAEEKMREKRIESEQLEAIYGLMLSKKDVFGSTSMDDIRNQMKFYCA